MFGSEDFTTFAIIRCTRLRSILLLAEMSSTSLAQRKISQLAVSHASISTRTDPQGSLQLKRGTIT